MTVFLDVGGVLLDEANLETEQAELIAGIIARTKPYSVSDYWDDTEAAVQCYASSTYDYVLYKNLGKGAFRAAKAAFRASWAAREHLFRPMPGVVSLVQRLAPAYQLGILGQYGDEILPFLEQWGILACFTFRKTQAAFRFTKPDPRYFEEVLNHYAVPAQDSVMIGDRIDKDVIPAKQVGMKTIRVRTGLHRRQEPRVPFEIPDLTVDHLDELSLQAIDRLLASR